jgi:hypothetical protein
LKTSVSLMNFIKNELHDKLGTHLECCVRMKVQNDYKVATFPCDDSWVGADSKDRAINRLLLDCSASGFFFFCALSSCFWRYQLAT